jgi:PilZ domain
VKDAFTVVHSLTNESQSRACTLANHYLFGAALRMSVWGGLGATIVGELAVNDVVSMQIPLFGGHQLDVRAVVRNRKGFHCGFEFLVLGESSRHMLRRFCEEIQIG